jgi:hypothetical protein
MSHSCLVPIQVAFKDCVIQGENSANHKYICDLWCKVLLESVGGVEAMVPKTWCSVVGDNTSVMPAAGKMLEEKYPTIFFNGCRTHCSDLLVEDIAKLPEIGLILEDCLLVVKFVLGHSKVKEAYKRIMLELGEGTTLKLFSETRFAQCCKMLESLLGKDNCNIAVLQHLINEDPWQESTSDGIPKEKVESFADLVRNDVFFRRIKGLYKLFSVLSAFVHHQETSGARASFVSPLFNALVLDVDRWSATKVQEDDFQQATLNDVKAVVSARWKGDRSRNKVGLYGPQYLMAVIVDPVLCLKYDLLPEDWKNECKKILQRFYPGNSSARKMMGAVKQLEDCVLRRGSFGKEVKEQQQLMEKVIGRPPNKVAFGHVRHEIKRQRAALDLTDPSNLWQLEIGKQCPMLKDIALRLLQMGTQSADVERCCKANKVIHTKVRNRLGEDNVKMLVYCYINLRLLKQNEETGGGSFDPTDDLEDVFVEAILTGEEPEMPQNNEQKEQNSSVEG